MTPQRLTAIVAILWAFPVNADELVDRADANGDGYVSLYELRAAYYADMEFNRRIEQSFADYDTDGDGLISEAERRAHAVATAETAPGAGLAAKPAGETAMNPATGTESAAASGQTAVTPVTIPAPATAAGMTSTPAGATTAAEVVPTPAAGSSAAEAPKTRSSPSAGTMSVGTAGLDTSADSSGGRSPEVASATTSADGTLLDISGLSRSELWIRRIDVDDSGGASISELVASGDGSQWFHESDFTSADRNSDGDLDPDELEVLIQSMERRHRR